MSDSPFAKAMAEAARQPAPGAIATNAQKARALMAMVQADGAVPDDIPPERLRDWARDLVRTMEKGAPKTDAPAAAPPRKARLFSHGAPTLSPPPSRPRAEPEQRLPVFAPPHAAPTAVQAPGCVAKNGVIAAQAAALRPDEVATLIAQTLQSEQLAQEHPAIIAVTLLGKTSLEQAAILRGLHGSQARIVHRALRRLEQGPFNPAGAETVSQM